MSGYGFYYSTMKVLACGMGYIRRIRRISFMSRYLFKEVVEAVVRQLVGTFIKSKTRLRTTRQFGHFQLSLEFCQRPRTRIRTAMANMRS
jgi:hypothetical protein